jgi:methylmalonyl-CoA/ethylmalonyl-CoA epimerase
MSSDSQPTPIGTRFGQVAWVVPDIRATEQFFREALGVPGFAKLENIQAQETEGTYRGEPGDFTFHLYMTVSGDSLLELIQPVSGHSIFQEFLDTHPQGGVQHVAFIVPEAEFDAEVAQLEQKGYRVVQSLRLPVARVAFFGTESAIGVATEIIGVTEAGTEFVAQLQRGEF